MKRRDFLHATAAAGAVSLPLASGAYAAPAGTAERQVLELRSYTLKPGKRDLFDGFAEHALLPAMARHGGGPVGVFYENADSDTPIAWVLFAGSNLPALLAASQQVAQDAEYLKAAADYLAAPAGDPVYDRIDSSVLRGIEGMPALVKPALKDRLFNLRFYESHNEAAAAKKIELFNQGELDIFRRVGLTPVFFGEALVGARLPNLTYMLVFDDDAGRQEAWNRFRGDAEWQKLKAIPEYEDKRIVSKITNKILAPAKYSRI